MGPLSPYGHTILGALWVLPLVTALVSIYPATTGISTNEKFNISICQDGICHKSPVYMSSSDGRVNDDRAVHGNRTMSWTSFAFTGASVNVTVKVLTQGEDFNNCIVRPKSYDYTCLKVGIKEARFTVTNTPRMMSVEFDNDYLNINEGTDIRDKLLVFADPPETAVPARGKPGVLYYDIGVHDLDGQYEIPLSISEVYLSPGSWVKGGFRTTHDSQSVKIHGRGVIDNSGYSKRNQSFHNAMITLDKGSRHVVEGLVLSDSMWFFLRGLTPNNVVRNVKTVGAWMHNTDGVVLGVNGRVMDSFFHANDDVIKLYYRGLRVQRCVVWSAQNGAVFQTGWNSNRYLNSVLVTNVDVIHTDWCAFKNGGNSCSLNRNNAVFNNRPNGGMSFNIRGLKLRNIRVEGHCPRIIFWQMSDGSRGIVSNARFVNWTVESQPITEQPTNRISGIRGVRITNWCFNNFRVAGRAVNNAQDLRLVTDASIASSIGFSCPRKRN